MSVGQMESKILGIAKKDFFYVLLLAAIVLFNIIGHSSQRKSDEPASQNLSIETNMAQFRFSAENFEKKMHENPRFEIFIKYFLLSLAVALFCGLLIDVFLIIWKVQGRWIYKAPPFNAEIRWTIGDIVKVFILVTSLIYLPVIIHKFFLNTFGLGQSEDIRILFTTSVMDFSALILVLYIVIKKRGQTLEALGIARTRFLRNVVLGFIGYLCVLPIFLFVIFFVMLVVTLLGYSPSEQQILTMFIRQENPFTLAYMIILTIFLGPVIEEIFFRGFVYPVLRAKLGVPMAIGLTSILFSFLHFKAIVFVPILVLGVILAYVYEKTSSLIASITLHIIHNSAMLIFILILKQFL